jgi:hypothetical protein
MPTKHDIHLLIGGRGMIGKSIDLVFIIGNINIRRMRLDEVPR